MRVVHTCEQTIRKRMKEFGSTNMALKTVEEIKRIEAGPGCLKKDDSDALVDEDLEPPIVRQRLRQELQCTESELSKFLSILDEKAKRMSEKLAIKEGND